jgi:hypothetical protein
VAFLGGSRKEIVRRDCTDRGVRDGRRDREAAPKVRLSISCNCQRICLAGQHRADPRLTLIASHRGTETQLPLRFRPAQVLTETLLREAGFSDARVESLPATFELASADEYFRVFRDVANRLGQVWRHGGGRYSLT